MKRFLIMVVVLAAAACQAQLGTTTQLRHGGTLPSTCSPNNGDVFFKTGTSIGAYECVSANTWQQIHTTGAGTGTVTHTGALTSNELVLGNGTDDIKPLGSAGTTTTVLHGNASGTPSFGSVATGDIASNAVTSAKLAVVNTRRTCMIQVGDGTNSVSSGDYAPFKAGRCYVPYAATIVEVLLQSDAGTPSVQLQKRHGASTVTDLLSGALAAAGTTKTCALTSTSGACIDGTTSSGSITIATTSLAAGDYVEVKSGTASSETNMTIAIVWTVD